MAKEAKVDYDEENDILYVYIGEKAKDSLEIDNFVLDISADNKVVGVEIFNASVFIRKLSGSKISKEILSTVKKAMISFYSGKEFFYVFIILPIKINGIEKEINLQVPAPAAVMVET
jgi:uncharacterized protein YuzE